MTAFIVFAHGSRVEAANQAVRDIAARMAASGEHIVETAFLELGEPDLASAAARLAARGISRIVVIPYFLTLGTHLQRDLPRIVARAGATLRNVHIEATAPLDGHPALLDALLDRAQEALIAAKDPA